MRRPLYLATLLILQAALILKLAPPLANAIRTDVAPGLAPGGWPALLQLVATATAVAGASLALAFPVVAMSRHRRGGLLRFLGLPGWAIALALAGVAVFLAGSLALASVPMLPVDARMTVVLLARTGTAGGLALMIAGVLSAELLRRNVISKRALETSASLRLGGIEGARSPELGTRTL